MFLLKLAQGAVIMMNLYRDSKEYLRVGQKIISIIKD